MTTDTVMDQSDPGNPLIQPLQTNKGEKKKPCLVDESFVLFSLLSDLNGLFGQDLLRLNSLFRQHLLRLSHFLQNQTYPIQANHQQCLQHRPQKIKTQKHPPHLGPIPQSLLHRQK